MPDFTIFEFDSSPFQPLRDELAGEPLLSTDRVVDGRLPVPTGPGLGIDVNEDVFAEYPYEIDTTISLDGLVANHEKVFEYADPSWRRVRRASSSRSAGSVTSSRTMAFTDGKRPR